MMVKQSFQDRYYQLLKLYVARPQEKHLAEAAELGRELVLADIPIEEIAELHEQALRHLGQDIPDIKLPDSDQLISAPLMELLMSYGLAGREVAVKQKQAQEEVRKLSYAVEQSPASIMMTDTAGNLEYVNPKFTQVTGYTREEVFGKNPRFLKSGKTPPEKYQRLWQTITAGGEWRGEFYNKKKNGELYWESASISAIKNAQGDITHFLAVKEDITERKQLQEQLLQAQKMETVGTLVGGVAHDFNNLLTAILGNAGFGLQNVRPDNPVYEYFVQIEKVAIKASELTNRLLSFSRRQVLRKKIINLNQTIDDLLKMLRCILGEDIQLSVECSPKLAPVYADPGQVQQVLMNLFTNARDAMPHGGKLTLKTRNLTKEELPAQLKGRGEPKDYVQIVMTDTGTGIVKESLSRIFDPFYTTKEVGKGTGLGLAVVHGIVAQHEGHVEVESEVGRGATFKIFFPAVTDAEAAEENQKKMSVIAGGGETILLLEDDEAVRNVTLRILKGLSYQVLTAEDERSAMKLLKSEKEKIDLVILDVVLPKESGPEIYTRLSQVQPGLPVLFMTGYDVEAKLAGFDPDAEQTSFAVLQKPFTKATLGQKVFELIENEA
ncbi:MAG: PAS domain S-box protein [bacterium]